MNELLHLLSDPAHWGFEFISDVVFGTVTFVWGRGWLRRHDRKVHGVQPAAVPELTMFRTADGRTYFAPADS